MLLMCVCTVILNGVLQKQPLLFEFKRDTGRVGVVTGGWLVCTTEAYPHESKARRDARERVPSRAKSTPVDLNVFWTPGRRSLRGIPEGKLIESARGRSCFIYSRKSAALRVVQKRRQLSLSLTLAPPLKTVTTCFDQSGLVAFSCSANVHDFLPFLLSS